MGFAGLMADYLIVATADLEQHGPVSGVGGKALFVIKLLVFEAHATDRLSAVAWSASYDFITLQAPTYVFTLV